MWNMDVHIQSSLLNDFYHVSSVFLIYTVFFISNKTFSPPEVSRQQLELIKTQSVSSNI